MNNRFYFTRGMKDGTPIALGYFAVSFAIGIAAKGAEIDAVPAAIMSLLNLTSAGEAAAIALIKAGTTYIELIIAQIVINLRYMLMSCSLSQKFSSDTSTVHRLLVGYGVTDEIFALCSLHHGKLNPFYAYGAISVAAPAWTFGTFLGVVCGNLLPSNIVSALSVAIYSMFIAIIIPPAKKHKVIKVLVPVSMLASCLFSKLPVISNISSGFRIIILTIIIAGTAAVFFPVKEEVYNEN